MKKRAAGAGEGGRRAAQDDTAASPLTDRAYLAIKREIVSNRFGPGTLLPVERIVGDMKFSRTPVREAILRLQREGLVEVRPRMGTFVSPLDLTRIREMYQVRGVLEAAAARSVALRRDRTEYLRASVNLRIREQDLEALSDAGRALHSACVAGCGNRVLQETVAALNDHFERFRRISLELPEKVVSSHREHLAIFKAVERGDADLAERLVREHFEHAAEYLMKGLLETGGTSGLSLSLRA